MIVFLAFDFYDYKVQSDQIRPLSTEKSQDPNSPEISTPAESDTTPAQDSLQPTQEDVELVNPNALISRQTPSEMSGSKIKRLKKKIREQGFDLKQPIEVVDIDVKFIILDGHRASAARQLRLQFVPIKRSEVTPNQEQQLLLEAAEADKYRQY